ncbi:MAG TPA: galactose-1-phosphate uridylyltransferase [Microthrixaceae bacterium]|jgi:UDPglucose--hexose-1-phosphate uridylyltransferase|nr:galactose-1-phosphate uridylyltransferase [Microthrixaceae bacterium]HQF92999.1 galactose-1-phosphate uridylyltransferase [Microthrixaceae bacterium]
MSGELRLDPLTGNWVSIVGNRQARPNLPATGCPFCVGGLEAPEPYDTKAFVNRWPAYAPGEPVDLAAAAATGRAAAVGAAEVILYSPVHDGSLGSLGVAQVRKVVDLWAERTAALLARPEVEYVLVFESRGAEVGATIHHPHGQLYAFPFVPPLPATEAGRSRDIGCVVCSSITTELDVAERVVVDDGEWAAWVPFASGYPYGVDLAPRRHVGSLADLDDAGRDSLARILTDVLGRYDRLWADDPKRSPIFPYLMWIHQAPANHDGEYHVHVHLAPPQRAPGVARYVAAGEAGAGTLSNPIVPEDAAATLRRA